MHVHPALGFFPGTPAVGGVVICTPHVGVQARGGRSPRPAFLEQTDSGSRLVPPPPLPTTEWRFSRKQENWGPGSCAAARQL